MAGWPPIVRQPPCCHATRPARPCPAVALPPYHIAAPSRDWSAALAAIRRTVTLGGGMTFEDGMEFELDTVVELAGTPDFAEGVDAFLAKRQPKWKTP